MEYMDIHGKADAGQPSSSSSQRPGATRKRAQASRDSSPVFRTREEVKEESPEPELDEVRELAC